MLKKFIWEFIGGCAGIARMVVILSGCIFGTVWITGWEEPNWRFWTVCGLIFTAYLCVAFLELVSDHRAKSVQEEK